MTRLMAKCLCIGLGYAQTCWLSSGKSLVLIVIASEAKQSSPNRRNWIASLCSRVTVWVSETVPRAQHHFLHFAHRVARQFINDVNCFGQFVRGKASAQCG